MSTTSSRSKFWRIFGYIVLALLILCFILGLIFWDRRYSFAENYAKSLLQKQGIEASLSIKKLTRDALIVENLELTYQSEADPFFEAGRIEADFVLRYALKGKVERLKLVDPRAILTLDENFQIIDGWFPQSQKKTPSAITIPKNGLILEEAAFLLKSPYGQGDIAMNASLRETDDFEAEVFISPTTLNYEDWNLSGSARLDLNVLGTTKTVDTLIRVDDLNGPNMSVAKSTLSAKGDLIVDTRLPIDLSKLDMKFQGDVEGEAHYLQTLPFVIKSSGFNWSGDIERQTSEEVPLRSRGELSLSTKDFAFTDTQRAKDFASLLTLSEAFAKTPIAQHFAPSVTRAVENIIENAEIETSAAIDFGSQKNTIHLTSPITVKKGRQNLRVTADKTMPVYQWVRASEELNINMGLTMNRPVELKLDDMKVTAHSRNGWLLEGIKAFDCVVSTRETWRVQPEGKAARLSPLRAKLGYKVSDKIRHLRVESGIDFDGQLPGGYVTGLQTSGLADLRLAPSGQTGLHLSYTPDRREMRVKHVLTDMDWDLSDVVFDLEKGSNIFELQGDETRIETSVSDVSLMAFNRVDARSLSLSVMNSDVVGALKVSEGLQNWNLGFQDAQILSDTIPTTGTQINITQGDLALQKSEDIDFDFQSPDVTIKLPQGDVQNLNLSAKGNFDQYTVEHSGGRFTSPLADIPAWPVSGDVVFANNKFEGQAIATITEARNTPLSIAYQYGEGEGEAQILLESLIFRPRGLQPQSLIPALFGKIAAVEGEVSADLNLTYVQGRPLKSGGVLSIKNMNLGTAPGPVSGLNADIRLTSLFPLETAGRQRLTIASFDPGIPLLNGDIEYDLVSDGIKIHTAYWPIGAGSFALDPFIWKYGAEENRLVMRLNEIPIEDLLADKANGKLEATGNVRGEFPIIVRGINVLVDRGYLEAKEGGVIRYNSEATASDKFSEDKFLQTWRTGDESLYNDLTREALREFNYRQLSVAIDGPLDGSVQLGVVFDGTNKNVLNGQPFEFDIGVEGELFNILQSFNTNTQIKSEVLRQARERTDPIQ